MHVCFLALEYFGWGKYGGIGKATRDIATGLAKQGVKVSVVVPLGVGQRQYELEDYVDVYGFPLTEYPLISRLLREINADIYHSQDLSFGTWLAKKTCGNRVHILTCQNPKTSEDWKKVNRFYPLRRRIYNQVVDPRIKKIVKDLTRVYCQARYSVEKSRELFELDYSPEFLPNPVKVPDRLPEKSDKPTVLFMGRFDAEKDPERFMRLAIEYPNIDFIAAGASHNLAYDEQLRVKYREVKNLYLPGFVDGEEKKQLLAKSWVLVNTSVSECLPVSFLEAAAHGCSILSPHDPDGFASRFGLHVQKNELGSGLGKLLQDENWRARGEAGYRYIRETHEEEKVIMRHFSEYRQLLE